MLLLLPNLRFPPPPRSKHLLACTHHPGPLPPLPPSPPSPPVHPLSPPHRADNVACDAVACVSNPDCIRRFFDPSGTSYAGCIKCDEQNCGPEFIRCAGANRRSSGILSDISRPGQQVCPVGYWSPPPPPMVEE